jgi:hypothetical protein
MKHSEQFAVSFLPISFFTYLPVKPPMKPGPPWKGSLENDEIVITPKVTLDCNQVSLVTSKDLQM